MDLLQTLPAILAVPYESRKAVRMQDVVNRAFNGMNRILESWADTDKLSQDSARSKNA